MGNLKNILVTGANGFLGSNLLESLIKKGYRPIAYLRPDSDTWRIKRFENYFLPFIAIDNSEKEIARLFDNYPIDAICHTATNYGRNETLSSIIQTNVLFPLKLLEEGAKHQLKIFVNTDTFFGKKQFVLKYLNNYTTSKRIFESILSELSLNIKIVNLRIEHVYGENDSEQKFVTNIIKQLINNTELLLTDGFQKRDFIYVDDVVEAYEKVLENIHLISGYREFEVGLGQSISVKQFVLKLAQVLNSQSVLKFGAIPTREGEIIDSFANNAQLKEIGWIPKYDINTAISKLYKTEKKRYTNEN